MSQFKSVTCPNCGAQLVGQANKYYCAYCNAVIETNDYDKIIKIEKVITTNINETKVIRNEAELEKLRQQKKSRKMLLFGIPIAIAAIILAGKFFPVYTMYAVLIALILWVMYLTVKW